jgi:O-antigen/teichoic acid export membrane protein
LYGSAISAPLYWIISSSDRWFIGAYLDMTALGIYAFTYNIAVIGQMLNSAISVTWRTEALKIHEENPEDAARALGQIWSRFMAILLIAWLAITAAAGDIIRLISDPQFHAGAVLVPWIAGAVMMRGIGQISGVGFMINKNMLPNTYWYIVAALACLLLNLWLIPQYQIWGAALAQFISFTIAAGGILLTAQRAYRMDIPLVKLGICMMSCIAAASVMVQPWSVSGWLSLLYKFPAGIAVVFLLLLYMDAAWLKATWLSVIKKLSGK